MRGINLGKRRIRMEDLRAAFVGMGFVDARTLIASGNVVFSADASDRLVDRIEAGLAAAFGFDVPAMVRSRDDLIALRDTDPFGGRSEDENCKLYVYFLGAPETGKLAAPLAVAGDYEIVSVTPREIFAVAHRLPHGRFGEGLDRIGKPFDRRITNRNWNTVLRLIDMAGNNAAN